MPAYEVIIPDKGKFIVESDKPLTDDQAYQYALSHYQPPKIDAMPEVVDALKSISDAYRTQGVYEAATVVGWGLFFAVVFAALGWTVGWVVRGFRANSDAERTLPTQEGRSWLLALIRRIVLR